MRLFLGIILGIALTIGGAFLFDASTTGIVQTTAANGTPGKPMVNWDVVGGRWHALSADVRETWHRVASR